jgi:hypothetical protein
MARGGHTTASWGGRGAGTMTFLPYFRVLTGTDVAGIRIFLAPLARPTERNPRRCQRATASTHATTKVGPIWPKRDSNNQKILSTLLSRSRLGLARRRTMGPAGVLRSRSLPLRTVEHMDSMIATSMAVRWDSLADSGGLPLRVVVPSVATDEIVARHSSENRIGPCGRGPAAWPAALTTFGRTRNIIIRFPGRTLTSSGFFGRPP